MKNVTITLPDELAKRARVEAAKREKSLSRYLADLLAQEIGEPAKLETEAERKRRRKVQMAALEKFLSGPGYPGVAANLPSREELYAERLFRRHEHPPVRVGPKNAKQTRKGTRVARHAGK